LARQIIATNELTVARAAGDETPTAHLRTRVGGYAVDMVIFSAITMVMIVLAGFVLLFSTNWAEQDASDAQIYAFLAIIGLGVPLVWTVLNLGLLSTRGQTAGQYVAGLRLRTEDGLRLSPRAAATWWFCFNPLLFSWPMALIAGLPLVAVISLISGRLVFVAFGMVVTLCIAAPIVAFVSAAIDGQKRALHDRIAGVVAQAAE
jgi:hypothetical protein